MLPGLREQLSIGRLREAQGARRLHVMTSVFQVQRGHGIHVLVEQKPHEAEM